MAVISAPNIAGKDVEIRRLAGCKFLLTMIFQQDGDPWDIIGLNIKIRVTNNNDAFVNTWVKNTHFSLVGTNTIVFNRSTPESLGLNQPILYKIMVYDDSTSGIDPLAHFFLYVDTGLTQTNRAAYSTGAYTPEALILNVAASIPGISTEIYGQLLTEISLLQGEIETLQSQLTAQVFDNLEDIEAAATGPYPKTFALVTGGIGTIYYFLPGLPTILEAFTYVAGGPPVAPTGPTISQRLATLEESTITEVTDYDELVDIPYLSLTRMRTLFVSAETDDGDGGTYPSGLYGLFPTGQIKYLLNGAEYRADQTT